MMPTGTHINYYLVCKRKLWLFARGVVMEQTSDAVLLGKLIDESSYERKDKGIDIDGTIVIDWVDGKSGVVHEVKKSDRMEEAHIWQVLYYLWFLKQKGVAVAEGDGQAGFRGEIDYPKLKQKTTVVLTPEKESQLLELLGNIRTVMERRDAPERLKKRFCRTCSYHDLCWSTG